jgi:hypothetical protein
MVSALKLLGMVSHAPSAGSPAAHLFLTRFSRIECPSWMTLPRQFGSSPAGVRLKR